METVKILFLVPPNINFRHFTAPDQNMRQVIKKDGRAYGNLMTDMPLGLLSMSGYLKAHSKKNIDIRLIDFNIELNDLDAFTHDSYLNYFREFLDDQKTRFDPDIIGISSLFTPSYFSLLDLGRACRAIFPKALCIAGGSVPSAMYQKVLASCPEFDGLCYGEGERPLLDLIESDHRKTLLAQHPSWITSEKLSAGASFEHDFVENLDDIPFYDYDLCDPARYGINPGMTAYAPVREKAGNSFHVMTSRGCPFKCTFCASHQVHGRKMRYYSLERVIQDFQLLKERYGAKTLIFQDDHFMGDRERAYQIVCLVKDMGFTAVFQNGLALYALDRRMLEALRDAGVKQLVLAAESGSERVLKKVMRKPLKLPIVSQVAKDCRELGIYTSVNILIGLPGETKQDIEDSREFLKTIDANWFIILAASPLVGSEMYDICEKEGFLTENHLGSDYRKAVIQTNDFSSDYIQEKMYAINIELNFVENADLRMGKYALALQGFENAIRAKNDHAIAYHYAGLCYEQLKDHKKAEDYKLKAKRFAAHNPTWQRYIHDFNIPIDQS